MKNLLSVLVVLTVAVLPLKAEEAGVHRFANYNVRYANPNNGDTGEKKWSNRKEFVKKIVTDYDFDIVGMEEVTGNNKDEVTGKSQLQDLRELLTDYADWAVEREGKNYEYNVIFYKKAKYELLDKGRFYMNSHPETPGEGWTTGSENNLPRALGWVRLKDKASGQEFYFAVAHINYGLYASGIESCKLIGQRLKSIAGQTPVVLVGDFNTRRDDHETAYRGIASHLYDLALTAPENICLPESGPQLTSTTTGWTPAKNSSSGSEFDYIFYDHMEPLSRHIITEYYPELGRTVNPSDHYPLLGRFRLGSAAHPTRFYASDAATLKQALEDVTMGDTICLKQGTIMLTEQIAPKCSFTMIGGYNDDYSQIKGVTTLTIENPTQSMISIPHYYSLTLENIELKAGRTDYLSGGGAIYSKGANLSLKNCLFTDNSATSGGAISTTVDSLYIAGCIFTGNSAKYGGGVYAKVRTHAQVEDCRFFRNEATDGGAAMMVAEFYTLFVQRNSFYENESSKCGALYIYPTETALSANLLNNCFLNNHLSSKNGLDAVIKYYGGAAVNARMNSNNQLFNMAHCTLLGNRVDFSGTSTANFKGAAINVFSGRACLMNNLMIGNSLTLGDGTKRYSDMMVTEETNIWRNTYTLTSESEEISGWEDKLTETFAGKWDDGIYEAQVKEDGSYPILKKTLADYDIACIPTTQRLCEGAFSYDINGDGTIGGYVAHDMLKQQRTLKSCIGALEYSGTDTGVENTESETGALLNKANVRVFSITGTEVSIERMQQGGVYILTDGINTKKIIIR